MIDNQHILESLSGKFSSEILQQEVLYGILTVTVSPAVLHDTIQFLKETERLEFEFLTDLCGIHYPDQEDPFGVVYLMYNMRENTRVRIKTFLPKENPSIPTVTDLFSAANWMERETYDFYGVNFMGHPNLIRILNVEYLDYFPLRKEYPLEDPTREDKDNRFFGREASV
ncbi:MAG: NADH-quinone oxidoreductase subunit C [Bacteroidetes bacterium]|nr:NADH-quinone oxidoreductase subunit C [Bacteroidota bacterium]